MTVANLAAERSKTKLEWRGTERRQAGNFDSNLSKLCAAEAAAVAVSPHALAPRILSTVPGHDAISLSTICPTAMLVVPSVGGICHHPDEFTEDTDMVLGTEVLTRVLWRLCEKGGRP
jgi:N-carbamoyl-L-amino-acid hydrolase